MHIKIREPILNIHLIFYRPVYYRIPLPGGGGGKSKDLEIKVGTKVTQLYTTPDSLNHTSAKPLE